MSSGKYIQGTLPGFYGFQEKPKTSKELLCPTIHCNCLIKTGDLDVYICPKCGNSNYLVHWNSGTKLVRVGEYNPRVVNTNPNHFVWDKRRKKMNSHTNNM